MASFKFGTWGQLSKCCDFGRLNYYTGSEFQQVVLKIIRRHGSSVDRNPDESVFFVMGIQIDVKIFFHELVLFFGLFSITPWKHS